MSKKIFISYRREDSSWSTGRIYDRLIKSFSEDQIFIDIDSIGLGDDFVAYIENSVNNCDVLLAIIGSKWLKIIKQKSGEVDFVRLEIAAALKKNSKVIPILLENTKMPNENELPEDIRPLARRNAFFINPISFNSEIEKLILNLHKFFSVAELYEQPIPTIKTGEQEPERNMPAESSEGIFNKPIPDEKFEQVLSHKGQQAQVSESFSPSGILNNNGGDKKGNLSEPQTFTFNQEQGFNPNDYPLLQDEVKVIKSKLNDYPTINSIEIIISFAKDHSLKAEWVNTNQRLTDGLRNHAIRLDEIEQLFSRSRSNLAFQNELKEYLRVQLASS
jgi:hypothetical protein